MTLKTGVMMLKIKLCHHRNKLHLKFKIKKSHFKWYYMAWLNSNVECGLLFLDNRPLLSITHRCHEKQSVAMDSQDSNRRDGAYYFL